MVVVFVFVFLVRSTILKVGEWESQQRSNGMLNEQLSCGCTTNIDGNLGGGCGRVMGDVTSAWYGNYIYTLWKNGNQSSLVTKYWPQIKEAAVWQNSTAAQVGLPYKLQTTVRLLAVVICASG